jgi:hypothetical protein
MVTLKETIKGGKSESAIISGDPNNSLMIKRISLGANDPHRLPPPKSKSPLPQEKIEIIIEWICQEAK